MQTQQLTELVQPILAEHGLELDDLDVVSLGRNKVLRITVDGDGPKGRGPLLDDISAATAQISTALDESDAAGNSPFTLEVSSRGVSTPLTEPKHYRRNRGRLLKVWLADGQETGRIIAADDDGVTLDLSGREARLPFGEIEKAVVQVELNRPAGWDDDDEPELADVTGDDEEEEA